MENYEKLMKRCISLAKKGMGRTSPNPMVGCVVLNKSGQIISEGYHHKYGENHAERDALLKLKNGEEKGGTLVVNLEPCSHYGKTPPCADLIIERGINKVIIGCKDNNPKVNGGGIKKLKSAGIEIVENVLKNECRKLNEVFFTNIEKKRPFIALKTATTIDGKISTSTGDSKWITSQKARNFSKILRQKYDAILTSSNTIIADNPRMIHSKKIILDNNLRTDLTSDIYKNGEIFLVTSKKTNIDFPNVTVINPIIKDNNIDLNELMTKLYEHEIRSVFVEAGSVLSGSFIKNGLADKIYHFIAPKILNDNSGKSCFSGDNISKVSESVIYKVDSVKRLSPDVLITYTNFL